MSLARRDQAGVGVYDPARLVQGIRRTLAPMARFLLDSSAEVIATIPGEVHDMEGIHDHPYVGKCFQCGALKGRESLHCNDDATDPHQ